MIAAFNLFGDIRLDPIAFDDSVAYETQIEFFNVRAFESYAFQFGNLQSSYFL